MCPLDRGGLSAERARCGLRRWDGARKKAHGGSSVRGAGLLASSRSRRTLDEVYTICVVGTTRRAKIFQNGGSQAVRLPKDCRFPDGEVLVRREGRRVILEPIDEWPSSFRACLGAWPDEIERPAQEPVAGIEDPFE